MVPLFRILAILLAAITISAEPLTFIAFFERGKSAAEVFTLRGKSLCYVAVWAVVATAAIVIAAFDGVPNCLEVMAVIGIASIPVYLWRVYFQNYVFVERFVAENKRRLTYFLLEGLRLGNARFESISKAMEKVVIDFWTKKLVKKRWTGLCDPEIGELMFSVSLETARVVVENVGEDVHWIVLAFMREWLPLLNHVRVPLRAKAELEGQCIENQTLNCIAIILANETLEVREIRARHSTENHLPYLPTAGITARKTAAEGILQWPNCLFEIIDIGIRNIVYNTTELSAAINDREQACSNEDLPECVVSTLTKMIKAGYFHISPTKEINVAIRFWNSFMVVEGKDWNSSKTIELGPFRYITSVTWMGEDPAFVIEKRDVIEGTTFASGSRVLTGILRLKVDVEVKETHATWLQKADILGNEAGVWGRVEDFVQPVTPVCCSVDQRF